MNDRTGRSPRRRGWLFLWFERASLGAGMTVVAFVIERQLLKAIKKGGMATRPGPTLAPGDQAEVATARPTRDPGTSGG